MFQLLSVLICAELNSHYSLAFSWQVPIHLSSFRITYINCLNETRSWYDCFLIIDGNEFQNCRYCLVHVLFWCADWNIKLPLCEFNLLICASAVRGIFKYSPLFLDVPVFNCFLSATCYRLMRMIGVMFINWMLSDCSDPHLGII